MKTALNLSEETDLFFEKYWNIPDQHPPQWSDHWNFNSSIPNHDKRGCYALFDNKTIVYIGSGIGKSTERYLNHGLGDRLKRYWRRNTLHSSNKYMPTENWKEITSISTIGFPNEHYSLAAALEIYLISKIKPARNALHK